MSNNELTPKTKKPSKPVIVGRKGALSVQSADANLVKARIEMLNEVATAVKETLKDGTDYGIIPGTKKPTLFKSGAEKIAMLYGLRAEFTKEYREDREEGWLLYEFECKLIDGKGNFVAQGVGIASTREAKYSTQNPWDIQNTVAKMSKKRALVDAVLIVGNLSEVFTQDMEDNPLSTENAKKTLTKEEKFELYAIAYDVFSDIMDGAKSKAAGKRAVSEHLKTIFPTLKIEKRNIMAFDREDADKFIAYTDELKGKK